MPFSSHPKKSLSQPRIMEAFLHEFSRNFTVSVLTLKSLVPFELISIHSVRQRSNFIFLYIAAQLFPFHLWKTPSLTLMYVLGTAE